MQQNNELDIRLKKLLKEEDKLIGIISRTLSRYLNQVQKAENITYYDNIEWMDGSVSFWLYVIEMARRDFIAYYNHPNRKNLNTPAGRIWLSAYAFLFKDQYKISINVMVCKDCASQPEDFKCKTCFGSRVIKSEEGHKVSMSEILEMCKEACKSRKINIPVLNPSAQKLRENLAEKIQDPWLTKKVETLKEEKSL